MAERKVGIPTPSPEIEIGGGDPLRITAFEEIVTDTQTGNDYLRSLPDEALAQATELLKGLPFSIGDKETVGWKPRHNVTVRLAPRIVAPDAPEEEKGKHTMYFRFNEEAGKYSVNLSTHKDLTIRQYSGRDGKVSNLVRFSTDQPLNMAGKEVREVALLMPVEQPNRRQ